MEVQTDELWNACSDGDVEEAKSLLAQYGNQHNQKPNNQRLNHK